jgi:hypothetical protein
LELDCEPLNAFFALFYPAGALLWMAACNAARVQAKVLANLFEVGLVPRKAVTAPELVSSVVETRQMVLRLMLPVNL